MTAQNHRLAAPGQRQDEVLDFAATNRVKPRGRFIENDEVGVVDERLRQADAALHALGKFAHGAHVNLAQTDHFEQLFDPAVALFLAEMKKVSEKIERLARIEIAVKIRFLGQITDARLGLHVPR